MKASGKAIDESQIRALVDDLAESAANQGSGRRSELSYTTGRNRRRPNRVMENGGTPLSSLAFQAFRHGIEARCVEPPRNSDVAIIGNNE
jgi:hypothetical protein